MNLFKFKYIYIIIFLFAGVLCSEAYSAELNTICQKIVNTKPNVTAFSPDQLKSRFLLAHNHYRALYGLPNMVWDDGLARYAQAWANYLKSSNLCKMAHRSSLNLREGKSYGENLAWNSLRGFGLNLNKFISDPENVLYSWMRECAYYNWNNASCQAGQQCGHYTQAIWKSSLRVGCGVSICTETSPEERRQEIWVCNYDPAGNIIMKGVNGLTPLKPF
jgi:pathogenesis-related protein 1